MKSDQFDTVLKGYRGAVENIIHSIGSYQTYDSYKAELLDQISIMASEARDVIVRRGDTTTEGDDEL